MSTTQRPAFSVIMPCYNSEAYVRSAIHSILEQTYPNWELIAINDGSTDDTLSILTQYASSDPRIKVYSKANGGYISAVNMGLEKITGDYFLLLGSDDTLSADLFQTLCNVPGNPDCIAFRSVIVQDGQVLSVEHVTNFTDTSVAFDTTLADFSHCNPVSSAILFTRDTSKCYKRSLLGDLRYFGKYGFDADGIFSMLLCHKATSFALVPADGYFWTLRSDSLSGRKSSYAQNCDRVQNWTAFYTCLLNMNDEQLAAAEIEYLHYYLGILQEVWKVKRPFFAFFSETRTAVATINRMLERTGFPLTDSGQDRLLLRFPLLWKFYVTMPASLHTCLQAVKKLLKK